MDHWQVAYEYYLSKGFPEELILNQSITQEDAKQIVAFLSLRNPLSILEVGTFIGLSTTIMSMASSNNCRLVCIDPNLPVNVQSLEFKHYENRGSLIFLREMLIHFGFTEKVTLFEGFLSCYPSKGFREHLSLYNIDTQKIRIVGNEIGLFAPFDIVFLDGDHYSDAVLSDLNLLHNYISSDGVIILHDFIGGWSSQVMAGSESFIIHHPEYQLKIENNLGFIQRVSS